MMVWNEQHDVTPTPEEVESVAVLLEGAHGVHAVDIAEFFSTHHGLGGDVCRSWAWAGVAERIRDREHRRMSGIEEQ